MLAGEGGSRGRCERVRPDAAWNRSRACRRRACVGLPPWRANGALQHQLGAVRHAIDAGLLAQPCPTPQRGIVHHCTPSRHIARGSASSRATVRGYCPSHHAEHRQLQQQRLARTAAAAAPTRTLACCVQPHGPCSDSRHTPTQRRPHGPLPCAACSCRVSSRLRRAWTASC